MFIQENLIKCSGTHTHSQTHADKKVGGAMKIRILVETDIV